jgi:hypothetical protein
MGVKRRERIGDDPADAGLELTRLRAALESLATSDVGDDAFALFEFIRSMLEQASARGGVQQWVDGDLGVELERRAAGGTSLRVVADTHRRLLELFTVPFARLPFAEVANIAERVPALLGPAFVLVERDVVSVSLVRYLSDEDALEDTHPDEVTPPACDVASLVGSAFDDVEDTTPTRDVRRSGIVTSGEVEIAYDPERTLIAPPSTELLRRSRG